MKLYSSYDSRRLLCIKWQRSLRDRHLSAASKPLVWTSRAAKLYIFRCQSCCNRQPWKTSQSSRCLWSGRPRQLSVGSLGACQVCGGAPIFAVKNVATFTVRHGSFDKNLDRKILHSVLYVYVLAFLTLGLVLFGQSSVSQVALHHLRVGHTEESLFLHRPHLMLILCRPILRKHVMFCKIQNAKVRSKMVSISLSFTLYR